MSLLRLPTLFQVSIIVTFVTIIVCSFSLTGLAQTQSPPRPANSALSDPLAPPRPDPLRVVHDKGFWPFSFKDKAQYEGFELELWAKLAKDMAVEYELIPMDFPAILKGLENGEIDLALAAIPVTSSRQKRVDFSIPYYRNGLVALCRSSDEVPVEEQPSVDKNKSKNKKDKERKDKERRDKERTEIFSGKLVAVQKNSAAENYARQNITEAKLKVHTYQEEIFFELLAENVDMVFAEQSLIEAYLKKTNNNDLVICSPIYEPHNLAIALPKNSAHLKELNKRLKLFRSSEEFKELCLKWFGIVPTFGK